MMQHSLWITEECVISISSIIELIPPPAIILTIDNYRLHPIEATVCIILCACMIIIMRKDQHLIEAHKCLFILLYLFTFILTLSFCHISLQLCHAQLLMYSTSGRKKYLSVYMLMSEVYTHVVHVFGQNEAKSSPRPHA